MSNTRKATLNGKADPFDWDALVVDPKRATTSVALCFRADLNQQHQALVAELDAIDRDVTDARLGAKSPRVVKAEQIAALEAEMQAATRAIELTAMRRPDFRALCLEHPVRPGQQLDTAYGVNVETAFPALLAECATEPKRGVEFWTTLLDDVLNDGQYEKVCIAAWNVNRQDVTVPFSKRASAVTRSTSRT